MDLHEISRNGTRSDIQSFFEHLKLTEDGNDSIQQLINIKNNQKYAPLHCAIFSRNLETFTYLVDAGCDVNSKCHGTSPLHLSISIAILPNGGYQFGLTCALKLISCGCDLNSKDDQGITPLQLAAKYNLSPIVENILRTLSSPHDHDDDTPTNNLINAEHDHHHHQQQTVTDATNCRDRRGFRALHYASLNDSLQAAKLLLPVSDLLATNNQHQTSLHIAAYYGSRSVWKAIISYCHQKHLLNDLISMSDIFGRTPIEATCYSGNANFLTDVPVGYLEIHDLNLNNHPPHEHLSLSKHSPKNTAILSHPYCRLHHTCPPSAIEESNAPPENLKRLSVLLDDDNGILRGRDLESNVLFVDNCRSAAISDVLRVHEWSYVRKVQSTCEELAHRFGKTLKEQGGEDEEAEHEFGISHLDSDTAISKRSFEAAMYAAGSLCQAVDMIISKQVRNAFCAVRPPGHHAGPCGLMSGPDAGAGAESHGFCLLNNVSIGAAYAMNVHRDVIKRVAIVDFDVHHGNGTEETIRWLNPGLTTVDVLSPNLFGQIHTPRYKPWHDVDDAQNVLFISVHGYGPREPGYERFMPAAAFYPGTGKTCLPEVSTSSGATTNLGNSPQHRSLPPQKRNVNHEPLQSEEQDHDEGGGIDDSQDGPVDNEEDFDEDDDDDDDDSSFRGDQENADEGAGGGGDDGDDASPDEDDDFRSEQFVQSMHASSPYSCLLKTHQFKSTSAAATAGSGSYAPPLVLDIGVNFADDEMVQGEYRHQWRNYFRDIIFPKLMTFKPDCIFISAGFDAHKKDLINSGYISLVEEDYEWVTANLMKIANSTCEGRVVSALEGGYQLGGEFCSSFAKSVKSHVSTMCSPGLNSIAVKYDQEESEREKQEERLAIDAIREKKELKRIDSEKKLAEWRAMRNHAEQEYIQAVAGVENELLAAVVGQAPSGSAAAVAVALSGAGEGAGAVAGEEDEGSRSKRRRTSKVDYVALNKEIFSSSTNSVE